MNIIIGLFIAYFVITACILDEMYCYNGDWCFNPIENYYDWTKLNFSAVLFLTLLLNIIFIPYAIVYWLIKLFIFFLAAVKRK